MSTYSHPQESFCNTGIYNDEHLLGTPDKRLDELTWPERFADSLSLSDDGTPEHSRQISPASVLPTISAPPIKVLKFIEVCNFRRQSLPTRNIGPRIASWTW